MKSDIQEYLDDMVRDYKSEARVDTILGEPITEEFEKIELLAIIREIGWDLMVEFVGKK